MNRTVLVVQARSGSTRLPGKVLKPLVGKSVLSRMLERLRAVKAPLSLVVATTVDAADDPIVEVCNQEGVSTFRGHPTDCLDRHVLAARAFGAQVIVKIPSDCPLIDPAVVDQVLGAFDPKRFDYMSNLHPQTWPDGNDVEVMTLEALETAWREASAPFQREHTTPFLWDNPDRFRLGNVVWESGRDLSMSHRFVLDYPEDLAFIQRVFESLHTAAGPPFGLDAILELCERNPKLTDINARYCGVNWYRHELEQLKTVSSSETRQAPND